MALEQSPERDPAELPLDAAQLAEQLFVALDAEYGAWRIELYAENGHLRKWKRQEEGGRDALVRFDPPPLRPRG